MHRRLLDAATVGFSLPHGADVPSRSEVLKAEDPVAGNAVFRQKGPLLSVGSAEALCQMSGLTCG